jgi:hypothetical protein
MTIAGTAGSATMISARTVRIVTMRYAAGTPLANIMRKFAVVVITVVGLIFLGVGIFLMITSSWTPADGLVQSCQTRTSFSSSSHTRTYQQDCMVTWQADGQTHTSSVTFGGASIGPGSHVMLRVHGDAATEAAPAWAGYLFAGLGVAALGAVGFVSMRRRRRTKSTDLFVVETPSRSG